MENECPNCGHTLNKLRTDRQAVGRRVIELCWYICGTCRHVVLKEWTYQERKEEPSGRFESRAS